MFLLPKRDLKPNQIGPIIWLIEGNFAGTVWELPRQLLHVNLLQYPPEKNNPLLSDVLAPVILDFGDVQVIDNSLDRPLVALVLRLKAPHRLGSEAFPKDVIIEQHKPRPENRG